MNHKKSSDKSATKRTKTKKHIAKSPKNPSTIAKKKPAFGHRHTKRSDNLLDKLTSIHKKIMLVGFSLVMLTTIAVSITREPTSYATANGTVELRTIGGKCLDNRYARATLDNRIQLYSCNDTVAQRITFAEDQTLQVQGFCLDLYAAKLVPGTHIHLYRCGGYATQKWSMNDDGTITNLKSGLCLDVRRAWTKNGTPIQVYTCNKTAAQRWAKVSTAAAEKAADTATSQTSRKTTLTSESAPKEASSPDQNQSPVPTPPPITIADTRDSLVYGTYEPNTTNTGYSASTALTAYNAESTDSFTLSKGGVIENKIIYGDVKYTGSENLLIKNCLLVGGRHQPANTTAILDVNSTRSGIVTIQDSTVRARVPRDNRDGITGYKYRAYRNDISRTIDGFGAFVVPSRAGTNSADIVIAGNYVHDVAYTYNNQTAHSDGTHNDGLQIQGGRNISVIGNYFNMTSFTMDGGGTNPDKPWLIGTNNANGAGVVVQDNTGAGIDNSVVIENNYFARGLSHINIKPGMNFVLRDNKFYRETAIKPGGGWSGYWIRLDSRSGTVVDGLNSGSSSNRWIDGPYAGQPMTEPRDRGIHYNS